MSYENWKNKAQGFQTVDVRHIQGSFFEGLKKRAEALEVGEGLHIIQTFEPHPLYLSWRAWATSTTPSSGVRRSSMSGSAVWRRRKATAPLPSSRWLF